MKAAAAITGMGLVSPLGQDLAGVTAALAGDKVCRQMVEGYPPGQTVAAATVPETDFAGLLGGRGLKYHTRSTLMLARACLQALQSADLDPDGTDTPLSLMVGSALGNHSRITRYMRLLACDGPGTVQPMDAVDTTANSPVDFCAIRIGARGAVKMIATGACSGLDAIIEGARLIALGRAQHVLVAGFETLYPEMIATLDARGCLGPPTRSERTSGRPYSRTSQGMIPGEGAAALLLEHEGAAHCRGAPIKARVLGGDYTFSPFGRKSGLVQGLTRVGRQALQTANCAPSAVDWVCGNANGIPVNDRFELLALRQLFGPQPQGPAISSIKAFWGDACGAAGALAAVAAVGCMEAAFIPSTPGLENPWPEAEGLDLVTGAARTCILSRLLILGADAAGFCSGLVLGAA